MLIELWHHNSLQNDKFIGIIRTDVFDLRSGKVNHNIIQPDTPNVFRGDCKVLKYEERIWITENIIRRYVSKRTRVHRIITQKLHHNDFSIMNYLGYYELRLAIALDFTASNGVEPKTNPASMHYIGKEKGPDFLNPYQKTMVGVTNAVYQWGNQQEMHMYGFGALNSREVFEMTDYRKLARNKRVTNTKTMLELYKKTLGHVVPGVDNDFTSIISQMAKMAEPVQHYFVLLVICDGDKLDSEKTIQLLKQTQQCGLSIVFVGIGDQPFHHLKRFEQECRNVSFTRYVDDERQVARNALRDVSQHMLEYFASRKVVPEIY
jgi:hypothetical protein